MAASYPTSPKSFTTKLDGAGNKIFAAHVNDLQDEVTAMETALVTTGVAHGLKPSVAGAQDLGSASLPWGTVRTRAVQLDAVSTLTIAAGVVTVTRSSHALETESAAATDDLDTLTATGLTDGFLLVLRAANVAHVVTLKDGTGNLLLNGDCPLSSTDRTITLQYDGTNWRELARSTASSTANPMSLLKSGNGTSTAVGATNVDTIAITGLTAVDSLLVIVEIESVTANTGAVLLYNATDSVTVAEVTATNALPAGQQSQGTLTVKQRQSGATAVRGTGFMNRTSGTAAGVSDMHSTNATFTTNWTASWTLALRHGGVTATGTFSWSWAVYKVAGQ